jgi:hypothetical protein
MAARQCPGFRWNVTIEYSEMWAITRTASDRGSRHYLSMSMRGIAGGRASLAHGLDRRGRYTVAADVAGTAGQR